MSIKQREGAMFKILEGSEGNVLGVEVVGGYMKEDIEGLKKICDDMLAQGHDKLNFLIKIDQLDFGKSEFKAFYEDSKYALSHMKNLRHIAVVGQSKLEKFLIELDNMLLGSAKKELVEKYFDVADLEKAWEFVRS
jgi:hypothetical protein